MQRSSFFLRPFSDTLTDAGKDEAEQILNNLKGEWSERQTSARLTLTSKCTDCHFARTQRDL